MNAAYTYYCDNETIAGLEFPLPPTSIIKLISTNRFILFI